MGVLAYKISLKLELQKSTNSLRRCNILHERWKYIEANLSTILQQKTYNEKWLYKHYNRVSKMDIIPQIRQVC